MAKTFKNGDAVLHFFSKDEIPEVWDQLAPLYQKSIDRSCHGEYTVEDLYRIARQGAGVAGALYDKGELKVALMIGEIYYPHFKGANVFALGGSGYRKLFKALFPMLCEHLKKQGCEFLECCTSPGMTRYYRGSGLNKVYDVLRFQLQGR